MLKKIMSSLFSIAIVATMCTTVFASEISVKDFSYSNGAAFKQYFNYRDVVCLYQTTKKTDREYFGADLTTKLPASVYIKASADSSGSVDYSDSIHILGGTSGVTHIPLLENVPIDAPIYIIGQSKNKKSDTYIGSVYAN